MKTYTLKLRKFCIRKFSKGLFMILISPLWLCVLLILAFIDMTQALAEWYEDT